MQGYGAMRDAAETGIINASCHAVRAENFPAASTSPRTACLDGVDSSDAIALILGRRYGDLTVAGKSATEEEYEEARRNRKRILVFLEATEREDRQEAFVKRVEDYVHGHWRKTFHDQTELQNLVEAGVREADIGIRPDSAVSAAEQVTRMLADRPAAVSDITWLHVVLGSLRDEEVIDPIRFGSPEFQQQIHAIAHAGPAPLFDYAQAKQTSATTAALRITQGSPANWREGRNLVTLGITARGVISISLNVSGVNARSDMGYDMGEHHRLDPDVLLRRGGQVMGFAARWWQDLDPYERHDPLIYTAALHDVGKRRVEKAPETIPMSQHIQIPPECPTNPLVLIDPPRQVSRHGLAAAQEPERVVEMIRLALAALR
ncbi:MAG: DUF4062 domain-containing protein [Chloroflexota bacterium]|nr:DUF4062 domain-containing protein [Chloroflexota bacterium]